MSSVERLVNTRSKFIYHGVCSFDLLDVLMKAVRANAADSHELVLTTEANFLRGISSSMVIQCMAVLTARDVDKI